MAQKPSIHKSEFLEFSGGKNRFVLVGNEKEAVRFLRRFNSKYEKINLRRQLHPNTVRMVEKDLTTFFELVERPNVKIVRPSKRNRKLYQQAAQQFGQWKAFAVPLESETAKLVIRGKGKNRRLVELGAFTRYEKRYFDRKAFEADPDAEVERILSEFSDLDHVRILANLHMVGVKYESVRQVKKAVRKFISQYENVSAWLTGLAIASFRNQKQPTKRKGATKREKVKNKTIRRN